MSVAKVNNKSSKVAPKRGPAVKIAAKKGEKVERPGKKGPPKPAKPNNIMKYKNAEKDKMVMSKKERRQLKRSYRLHAELALSLLKMWEELRPVGCEAKKRERLCDEIISQSKEHMKVLFFSHDTGRIYQTVLKHGKEKHRTAIFEAAREHILQLATSKYGHFLVRKLIKYCTDTQRQSLFQIFQSHVRRLLVHSFSAEVLDYAFNNYADKTHRALIMRGLFGAYFLVVENNSLTTVQAAITAFPDKETSILSHVSKTVLGIVKKGLHGHVLAQHILFQLVDYFHQNNNGKSLSTERRADLLEAFKEHLLPLVHTRDGVKAAIRLIAWANAKDRKVMLSSLRTYFSALATHENGFLLILAFLETVDDSVRLHKIMIKELFESMDDLVNHVHGRHVLFHILCGRDPTHFPPAISALLQPLEGNENTKKSHEIRHQDLLKLCASSLLTHCNENVDTLLKRNSTIHLLLEVIVRSSSDKSMVKGIQTLLDSLCGHLNAPFSPLDVNSDLAKQLIEKTRRKRLAEGKGDNSAASKAEKKRLRLSAHVVHTKSKAPATFRFMPQQLQGKGKTESEKDSTTAADQEEDIDAQIHLVERSAGHLLLRRLTQWDKERVGQNEKALFSTTLLSNVDKKNLTSWTQSNRGCFTLLNIYEVGDPKVMASLKTLLQSHQKVIRSSDFPGAKLLCKKLNL